MKNTMRKKGIINLLTALLIAALMLCGCAQESMFAGNTSTPTPTVTPTPKPVEESQTDAAPAPASGGDTAETAPAPTTEPEGIGDAVTVSDVDEFLAALASDTTIILADGVYDLRLASDYAKAHDYGAYTWEEGYDGWQLVIRNLNNLTIRGNGPEAVRMETVPRYANVLTFRGCTNLNISGLTAGHTKQPGFCSGGVLEFGSCDTVNVNECSLFGCGTLGVNAINCKELRVFDSEIYECSYGAVCSLNCYDVEINNCSVHDCGTKDSDYCCFNLFEAGGTTGFALVNCDVENNKANVLLNSDYSREVKLLGCGFSGNRITDYAFRIGGSSPVVDGCSFGGNSIESYYEPNFSTYAVSAEGEDLISFDFNRMQRKPAVYEGMPKEETSVLPSVEREDGSAEYHVKTTDEFLAAIGPDRIVYLESEMFNFSEARNYGGYGGEYYHWEETYDGPTLVISDVSNFHIIGLGKDKTTILATPRYADVLRFADCENISVSNVTAGHTETGECAGDVFCFMNVNGILVDDCGLYGCGVWGISTSSCRQVQIENCEIYSCSFGAINMYDTVDAYMINLNIHDMPETYNGVFYGCVRIYLDDTMLDNGEWDLTA